MVKLFYLDFNVCRCDGSSC